MPDETRTQSEDRTRLFEAVSESSMAGIYVFREGKFIYVNPAVARIFGYERDELEGKLGPAELTHPDDRSKVAEYTRRRLAGEVESVHYTFRGVRKDGTDIQCEVLGRAVELAGGPAVAGTLFDITERERTQQDLLESEALFRGLAVKSPNGVFVNQKGRVVFANTAAAQLTGYSVAELTSPEFSFLQLIAPDSLAAVEWMFREHMSGRELEPYECRLIGKGGNELESIIATRLIAYEGEPAILGIVTDVTQRKAAELELRRSLLEERRYRKLAEAVARVGLTLTSDIQLPELLNLISRESTDVFEVNSAFVWMVEGEELVGFAGHGAGIEGFVGRRLSLADTGSLAPKVVNEARPIYVNHARSSKMVNQMLLEIFDGQAILGAPLIRGGKVDGVLILIESSDPERFKDDDLEPAMVLGGQMAIAIENGRLFQRAQEELTERRRAESALAISVAHLERAVIDAERLAATEAALRDSVAALTRTLDLDEVLDRILANVGRVVPSDTVDIMLLRNEEGSDILVGVRGRGYTDRGLEGWLESLRLPVQAVPSFQRIVQSGQPYAIPDVNEVADWIEFPGTEWIRSYAAAPIKSKGELIGILNLCSETAGFFSPAHADVLQSFADQAAVAIENARLFSQARQELSERRRAEQELRLLSELNASVLEEMADGVAVQDSQGYFTFVNPAAAALFGYSPDELVGQLWTRFVPADQRPLVQLADERRRRGLTDRYELELLGKGGKAIPVLVSGRPRFEGGEFVGTIAVFTDITERKRAEEGERAYLRSKEGVLVSASRSLRTPTQSMIGSLEEIVGGQIDDPQVRQDILARALEDAQNLAYLVENVIGVAEMDSRSVELDWGVVAVGELVSDILLSHEGLAHEKGVSLAWESPDLSLLIRADRTQLRQALGNVVERAIRSTESGTAVRVEAEPKGGGIEIRVTDRGPGISKADQLRIFEEPHLRPGGPSRKATEAGAGLHDSRTIIESHGGSIWVESEPGRGSVFTIFVPGYR